MRGFVIAVPLLLLACAIAPLVPPAEKVARLPPYDQDALVVDGELVRVTGWENDVGVVAMKDVGGRLAYTYVGPWRDYRGSMLVGESEALMAMGRARLASPFHAPLEVKIGTAMAFCVPDRIPKGTGESPGDKLRLSFFDQDPHQQPLANPWSVVDLEESPDAKTHGSMGLVLAAPPPEEALSTGRPAGAKVVAVMPGGPAERAGLRAGDVIAEVAGHEVGSADSVLAATAGRAPGTEVEVGALRGRERKVLRLVLVESAKSKTLLRHNGTVVEVSAAWLSPDGRVSGVSLPTLVPSPPMLLEGKSSRDLWSVEDAPTEHILNDALVEWKNGELPGWLRRVDGQELVRAITTTEKGVLALDVSIRLLKDKLDAAARESKEVQGGGEAEQLMEQRKMLLGVVLQTMKATPLRAMP